MAETWFDTRTGELLVGIEAAAPRIDEGGPLNVAKLGGLLVADEFPYTAGDFERPPMSAWTEQDVLDLGRWTLNITEEYIGDAPPFQRLTREHLVRLNVLGLAPSWRYFRKTYNYIGEYRRQLGLHYGRNNFEFEDWTTADFVKYASRIAKNLGRKPIEDDYDKAYQSGGPNAAYLAQRFSGLSGLNDLIGYPDIKRWKEADYLYYGRRVMEANGGVKPSTAVLDTLSHHHLGPSRKAVVAHFGSLRNFQKLVIEDYQLYLKEKLDLQDKLLKTYAQLGMPEEEGNSAEQIAAKYLLARCFLTEEKARSAEVLLADNKKIIKKLRHPAAGIGAGSIERAAVALGVFDYIWPVDSGLARLKVNPDEIEDRRARNYRRNHKDAV